MRKMASLASAYDRQQLPASLMQRLALMQQLALAAQANAGANAHPQRRARGPRLGAHAIVLAWFSLGVLTSGALGAGTVVAMRSHAAGGAPLDAIASLVAMDWAAWAKAPSAAVAPEQDAAWDTVQVAMSRAERTPLSLQVTGAGSSAFEVVIEGLPAGVRPSRGAPRGQAWVLGRDDLDGLFLTLEATVPAAFDVKVALSLPPGVATSGSIVQIRLIDSVEQKQAAATGGDLQLAGLAPGPGMSIAGAPPAHSPEATGTAAARSGAKPVGSSAQRRAAAATSAGTEAAGSRAWPEGASALGAVSREPDRRSWWQMPLSWSPFVVGHERP